MKEFVFDIETIGSNWESMDNKTQDYLIKRFDSEDNAKSLLGLSPLTGRIIVISILSIQDKIIYTFIEGDNTSLFDNNTYDYKRYKVIQNSGSEKDILLGFWNTIKKCDKFITFNGRSFDIPFIVIRSMYHNIKPTRKILTNRYYLNEHFDLYDQLTFYNAIKGFSLEMWCKFFNISNPKDKGIEGKDVEKYYNEKKIDEIAMYCNRDVIATAELYKKVKLFYY